MNLSKTDNSLLSFIIVLHPFWSISDVSIETIMFILASAMVTTSSPRIMATTISLAVAELSST